MAFRPKLLVLATAFLGLASPVSAAGLSALDAVSCSGQGTGYSSRSTRPNWTPEYYRGNAVSLPQGDTASTVKLRIIYEMGDRVEIDHCGGTVIDSNWVVTAGHCVAADLSWDRVEIIAGDEHLDGANAIKRISRDAVCHAGFRYQTLENDIALLRVDNPFPARVRPAAMDFEGTPSVQRGSIAMGHGWPVTGLRAGDRFLNQTPLQVHDVSLRSYITVTNAASASGGLCRGESGGPILSNGNYGKRLAGVLSGIQPGTENSMGEECMLGNYEMYFTPLAAYRRWIDNVKSLCTSNPAACGGTAAPMAYAAASPSYQTVPAAPQYQQPQYEAYQVAQVAAPTYQNTGYLDSPQQQATYIDISNSWGASVQVSQAPVQPTYYQPVTPTYAEPTYIHMGNQYGGTQYGGNPYGTMAPIYDDYAAYAPAPAFGGYTVAYAQPVTYGSMYPLRAR